jgi:tyrosinase
MMLLPLANLAILVTSILPHCVNPAAAAECTNPVIRKEWRKLSVLEKADWIRTINVSETIVYMRLESDQ